MTQTAYIRFAPIVTLERVNSEKWQGRTLYWNVKPINDNVPVIVDHDDAQRIGRVRSIFTLDWHDAGSGMGPWFVAECELDDPAPSFVKRHTPASFGFHKLSNNEDHISRALVTEITVCREQHPVEPLAEVISIQPVVERSPASRVPLLPNGAGETIPANGVIRRPAGGQVIGVR